MDREKESPPERLPFCLDDTVGEIVRACQECPGVYYIAARKQDGRFLADEYYVVERSSPAISKEAMTYGRMSEEDSRVLLYPFAEERHGYKIIEYEIYRYQVRHGMHADGQTSLRDVAFFNMEYHPEYFGTYPAPLATPRGRTARYKPLMNGVFWIETGTGEEVLAVCYPIWNCDFSETVLKQSEQSEEDVRKAYYHNPTEDALTLSHKGHAPYQGRKEQHTAVPCRFFCIRFHSLLSSTFYCRSENS